jgi:hypothetical protein
VRIRCAGQDLPATLNAANDIRHFDHNRVRAEDIKVIDYLRADEIDRDSFLRDEESRLSSSNAAQPRESVAAKRNLPAPKLLIRSGTILQRQLSQSIRALATSSLNVRLATTVKDEMRLDRNSCRFRTSHMIRALPEALANSHFAVFKVRRQNLRETAPALTWLRSARS